MGSVLGALGTVSTAMRVACGTNRCSRSRRFAATAVSGIAASLVKGLALIAAAEHPELFLLLRDHWSQDNAAKRERGLGEPVWSVGKAGSSPVITRKQ